MDKSLKRVYLTLYIWSEAGGVEEIVTSLAGGLKTAGVDVVVFAWTYQTQGKSQYERRLDEYGVRFVGPKGFWGRLAGNWQYRVQVLDRLAGWSLWILWPLTGVVSIAKHVSFGEARESLRNRVRHWLLKAIEFYTIDTFVNWQLTCTHWLKPATLVNQYGTGSPASMVWAHNRRLPLVYSEGNTPGQDDRLKTWDAIRDALKLAHQLTALSSGSKDGLVNVFGLDADKITVVTGPVQFEMRDASLTRQLEREPDDAFHILSVGRLDEWKGLPVLVRAVYLLVQKCPDIRLTFVGDGPEQAALTDLVHDLELELRVTFAGKVPHVDLPPYYQSGDVFVAPSLRFEGLGLVVPEAMSFGLPVVATDIPAFRDLVKPGENGLIVPSGNVGALAEALEWLLNHPEQRRLMGQQSRRLFEASGLDLQSFVRRTLSVYQKAVAQASVN